MIKVKSLIFTKKSWVLTLETEEEITLFEQVVVRNNLVSKKELSDKELLLIKQENTYYEALDKALIYLKRLKSEYEVKNYLYDLGYSSGMINQVIDYLIKYRFINDDLIINEVINKSVSNKVKIYNLEKRGISKVLFEHMLEDETELAVKVFNIYRRRLKTWDIKDKQKTIRHLLNKGFTYETVQLVIQKYDEEI